GTAANSTYGKGANAVLEISRAVRTLPPRPGRPHPRDLLLDGLALLSIEGHAAAAPTLQRAAKALTKIPLEDVLRWGWLAPGASAAVWDDEGMLASFARHVRLVRDAGALAELPIYLSSLAVAITWTGDFTSAASFIAEAESVAAAIG